MIRFLFLVSKLRYLDLGIFGDIIVFFQKMQLFVCDCNCVLHFSQQKERGDYKGMWSRRTSEAFMEIYMCKHVDPSCVDPATSLT